MVGPLTPLVLVWVWSHSLAVTCFVIGTLAAVLQPKIHLSHSRDRVPFGYKASTHTVMSKALNSDRWLFFYFCISVSIILFSVLQFPHFSVSTCPKIFGLLRNFGGNNLPIISGLPDHKYLASLIAPLQTYLTHFQFTEVKFNSNTSLWCNYIRTYYIHQTLPSHVRVLYQGSGNETRQHAAVLAVHLKIGRSLLK